MVFHATVPVFGFLGPIVGADVDCRDHLYSPKTEPPQVLGKQRRLTHVTLCVDVSTEPDLALRYGSSGYDCSTIPTGIYLKRLVGEIFSTCLPVRPEEVTGTMPSAILCDLPECFADY